MAEQFAFQQLAGDGGTVDGHEGPTFPLARLMNGPGNHLLARAAFPQQQNSGLAGRDPPRHTDDAAHLGGMSDDGRQGFGGKPRPEEGVFFPQSEEGERFIHHQPQLVAAERFGEIIESSHLHDADRGFHGSERGDRPGQNRLPFR